nr:RNA-directed DNA polymerase, eukaryota [Tanacetum cinerariifolium]
KRANLYVKGIMSEGECMDDPICVKDEFRNHFADRFNDPGTRHGRINFSFPNRLTNEQVFDLEASVSDEEIRKAVWGCGENKSPGPDGFTFELFRLRIDDALTISHLFYADDVIFIGEWSKENLKDNSISDFDNNTSDSASTSQIRTFEEIDYDSSDYRGPPKNDKGSNESDAKPSFSDISKAKACMLAKASSDASFKTKVQACGSKANKTFRVKIPPTMACAKIIVLSSDSLDDDGKGPSKASVPIFEGPSVQGFLDYYGYSNIEEYLSWNYFPSTDKENTDNDITDKDTTDEDCIHECNYAVSKGLFCGLLDAAEFQKGGGEGYPVASKRKLRGKSGIYKSTEVRETVALGAQKAIKKR